MDQQKIGECLKHLRKEKGFTQFIGAMKKKLAIRTQKTTCFWIDRMISIDFIKWLENIWIFVGFAPMLYKNIGA